jgi:hypothetical protein
MRDLQDPLPDQDPEFVHEEEQDDVSKIQSLLKELDMSVDEALTYVISMGAVSPGTAVIQEKRN